MRFTQVFTILSIIAGIEALGCQNPGMYTCAVITSSDISTLGLPGSTNTGLGVGVVDGSCGNIVASGSLTPDSPGFSADFKLTYGTDLYYGASYIGVGDISGVNFQYDGTSYDQSECFDISGGYGPSYESAIQCNFPC